MGLGGSKTKSTQSQKGSVGYQYVGEGGDTGPLTTLAGNYAGMAGQNWDLRNQLLGGSSYANAMRNAWMQAYPDLFGVPKTGTAPTTGAGGTTQKPPTTSTAPPSSTTPMAYSLSSGLEPGGPGPGPGTGDQQPSPPPTQPDGGNPPITTNPNPGGGISTKPGFKPYTPYPGTDTGTPTSSGEGDPSGVSFPDATGATPDGGLMGEYMKLLGSSGYDPATLSAMRQQSMEAARGASDSALMDMERRAAGTGNTAGYYGGRAQVAEGAQHALTNAAQNATIANYAEKVRQQDLGRQGLASILGLTDQDLNSYLSGASNILGMKRGAVSDALGSADSSSSNWGLNLGGLLGFL